MDSLKQSGATPHIARNTKSRRSVIDNRKAKSNGYKMSTQVRKRIEHGFGWAKTIGDLRKLPLVSLARVSGWSAWNLAAHNLVRLGGLGGWWNSLPK